MGWPAAEVADSPRVTEDRKCPLSRPAPRETAALMASVTASPSWTSFTATAVSRMAKGTFTSTDRTSAEAFCR